MGFAPAAVDTMSLWEFAACWRGWKKANTLDDAAGRPPTVEEHLAAVAFAETQTIH